MPELLLRDLTASRWPTDGVSQLVEVREPVGLPSTRSRDSFRCIALPPARNATRAQRE